MANIRIDKGFNKRIKKGGFARRPCQTYGQPPCKAPHPSGAGAGASRTFVTAGWAVAAALAAAALFVFVPRGGDCGQPRPQQPASSASLTVAQPLSPAGVSAAEPEAAAPARPDGLWRLDEPAGETAVDSAGTCHGTLNFSGDCRVPGKRGRALAFDGRDDNVSFPTNLAHLSGALTVSAWVKPASPPSGSGRVIASTFRWDADGKSRGWLLGYQYGSLDQMNFSIYSPVNNQRVSTTNVGFFAFHSNRWVHVAGVFKPGEYVAIYTNGVLANWSRTSLLEIGYWSGTNIRIGMRADNTTQGAWSGLIDEVAVYGAALSSEEIRASLPITDL